MERYVAAAGLILLAARQRPSRRKRSTRSAEEAFADVLKTVRAQAIADLLIKLFDDIHAREPVDRLVFQISRNRVVFAAIANSVPAVKGDAARTLFAVSGQGIAWAVIDSGIDRHHPAFMNTAGTESRVQKSFDFSQFRRIVNLSNTRPAMRKANLELLRRSRQASLPHDADDILKELAQDARAGREVSWSLVERMVVIDGDERPLSDHGTHVAGIIGANKTGPANAARLRNAVPALGYEDGMCPDISLYDFRVLTQDVRDTEFAIIAALQYIRDLNDRHRYMAIHGVNLSLSIPYDVRNYACGQTPVCLECEKLVGNGIVVVAAAGNFGYISFETIGGVFEGYTGSSITDPGNAEGVITVGSTSRYSPHTAGVSFFSSRGPTADGRLKPDLIAPGERISGPVPGAHWAELDGTSMAAAHVSGAAALLMARYSELIGQPRQIKRLLCENATDLGRERNFQGHGMLDVLRACQRM